MQSAVQQNRVVNFLFTVDVNGEEKCVQGVDGLLDSSLAAIDFSGSCMEDVVQLPGHYNKDNVTITHAPLHADKGGMRLPYPRFLFEVNLGNGLIGHARSITGISVTNDIIENREADHITTQKVIGLRHYGEVTFTQVVPVPEEPAFMDWLNKLMKITGPGQNFATLESQCLIEAIEDVTITVRNRCREMVGQFKLRLAHGAGLTAGTLESAGADVWIRSMTIRPLGVEWVQGIETGGFADWVMNAFTLPRKDTLTVRIYNRQGSTMLAKGMPVELGAPVAKFKLMNAWPAEVNLGDLDASADDIFTEEIVVATDGVMPA